MNPLRNSDGQLLLDFGKDNQHVYYNSAADGLYDALSSDNKELSLEMRDLYSMYEWLSGVKMDWNDPIVKRFVVLAEKYIQRNPDLYREFVSEKKICPEFSKFINNFVNINTLSQLDYNQVFSAHIDQKIQNIYAIRHQENIDTTSEILEMIKHLNKDVLKTTLADSIKTYSTMYLHDGLLTKDLAKFKEYRDEEKFEMDDIFVGNVDENFSKLFTSFFSDELETFSKKQTENQSSEDSIFTHFFTFVLTDVLTKLEEYVLLYKDQLNVYSVQALLEDLKRNFHLKSNLLSAKK